MRWGLIAAALIVASPAGAQTLQADYDAGQTALAKDDFAAAVPRFEAVLARMRKQAADPTNRTVALIRSQYALGLSGVGRLDEAKDQYRRALLGLARPNDADRRERALALTGLGRAEERSFEYGAARDAYREALALNVFPTDSLQSLDLSFGLGRATMISDPVAARAALDAALPTAAKLFASNGEKLGEAYALRGRVELNDGKPAIARQWFDRALSAAGGVTRKASMSDVRIRGDMALAAFALGDRANAKKFIAFTGAGRSVGKEPSTGADMEPPACGDDDVRPEDMAIIEFSIEPDGSTSGISPIYVSRRGIEAAFARSVAGWSWRPDEVEKLPAFWRHAMRLEMRCTTRLQSPGLTANLRPAVAAWAETIGATLPEVDRSEAVRRPQLLRLLREREARHGASSPQIVPVLFELGTGTVGPREDDVDYIRRAATIASAAGAPTEVRTLIAMRLADLEITAMTSAGSRRQRAAAADGQLAAFADRIRSEGHTATRGLSAMQAHRASIYEQNGEFAKADALYRQVADQLAATDPIRQFALLRLASRAAVARRMDEARGFFQATGLSAEQCAFVDVQPLKTGGTVTASSIPNEAFQWGFNGWVTIGYDIDAAGRPTGVRTLLAYPPFIYGESTARAVARFRFEPLYRGGSAVGCSGQSQTVRYQLNGF